MSNIAYNIYPSILDSYQRYLDTTPENYLYKAGDGKYHMNYSESTGEYLYSSEEVEEMAKQELIDKINRVPFSSEAATKGTVFNELVDMFVNRKRPSEVIVRYEKDKDALHAELDGKEFVFSYSFVEDYAKRFALSTPQLRVEAPIETMYGNVCLYGYIDELVHEDVIDIKTTSRYTFGDFADHWQRHVYPYCLIEGGYMTNVQSFTYSVVTLKGGTEKQPLITGSVNDEYYTYDHSQSKVLIKSFLERFIEFLQENRERITDKKIFNEHES